MRFIDPKTDFAFKRIFGSEDSQEALISFINAALKLKGKREVKSVEIQNPFQVRHLPVEKGSIVDIACTDRMGIKYIVEMQVEKVKGFANRMVYNLSKRYSGQLLKGDDYPKLNDVVLIAVMDFSLFEKLPNYHSLFVLKDMETNIAPFNQLRLCCLELAKFDKKEQELASMLDKWAYFLKETGQLEVRPETLKEKVFINAFEKAEVANLSPKEKEAYDYTIQEVRDKRGMIAQGWDEGHAEGETKGLAKGRAEEKEDIALKMLKSGLDDSVISKVTGLSKKEIEALTKK